MQYNKSLNQIVGEAHVMARDKGFYEDIDTLRGYLAGQDQPALSRIAKRDFVLGQLSEIASEVGETVQAIQRKDFYSEDVEEELADVVIRVCDLAGYLEINLGRRVEKKMQLNAMRPRKHGKIC